MSFACFLLALLGIIFVVEFVVMLVLSVLLPANTPILMEAMFDGILLALGAAGPIWWLLCCSLRRAIKAQRGSQERALMTAAQTQAILDASLEAIVSMDAAGVITAWNLQAEKVFGWSADEAIGRDLAETIVPERFRDAHRAGLERFRQTGASRVLNQRLELAGLHRDGREFPIELSLSMSPSAAGPTFTGFIHDISARKRSEEQLRKLSRVVEQTPTPVTITNVGGLIEFVNQAFVDSSGYTAEEAMGKNPRILKSGLMPAQTFIEMWNELRAGRYWRGDLLNRRKNGELYWVSAVISPLKDAHGKTTHYVGVQQDITARKKLEDELRRAARTDKLTGLINRALFCDRLERAMLCHRRHKDHHFAVLFLDLDRFKLINDTFGHEAGDRLLVQVAERLRSVVRCNDSLSRDESGPTASRFGGDEFVLLLDNITDPEHATGVAERLLKVLAEPFQVGEAEVFSPASIGIVTSATPAESPAEVLRNADIAMYEAKQRGKGRYVVFDDSMHSRVQNRMNLENDLRRALDAGQLFLLYQPIVSLETLAFESVEVLIRWNHPQRASSHPTSSSPSRRKPG